MIYTFQTKPTRVVDITGQPFGYWVVLHYAYRLPKRRYYWICRCMCGTERPVEGSCLKGGTSKSCGCRKIEAFISSATRHGLSRHPLYNVWRNMINRCYDPREIGYSNYGERCIRVCDRWRHGEDGQYAIQCFIVDMGERPKGFTLERKDVNGNYEPTNCEWISAADQHNNRRDNIYLTHNHETLTRAQWAVRMGVQPQLIKTRMERGWSVADALTRPLSVNQYKSIR